MSAQQYNNFLNRVDVEMIPEGWFNIAYKLVQEIESSIESRDVDPEISQHWKISQIELNESGRMTVTGTYISNFKKEIFDIAAVAEKVCCICGNPGNIEITNKNISLPLCKKHLKSANSTY